MAFYLIHAVNVRNARAQISEALEVGSGVFRSLLESRGRRLVEAARLLSADYAFKSAYGTGDEETILSALENHRNRIGADVMILSTLDYEVVADTRRPKTRAERLPFAALLDGAVERGEWEISAIVFLDGRPYQMVVVPMLTPVPDAWICVGFLVEEAFAAEFRATTLSHISLLARGAGAPGMPGPAAGGAVPPSSRIAPGPAPSAWRCFVSTLPAEESRALASSLAAVPFETNRSIPVTVREEEYVTLVTPLLGGSEVVAVLQRPLAQALRPYLRLRIVLVILFSAGIALCLVLGHFIARSISRPVLDVAASARKVEEGDYSQRLATDQKDEIGMLAASFNHMVRGLEEKDRVRDLLGKVVSPEIAQELLRRGVELGGEAREVTILFSDLRGFTNLSEHRTPHEILALLNDYLTRMSGVIESNGGVVDKYVGDMIMALFGAPLARGDDAERAVRTALGMRGALADHNAALSALGIAPLEIGIGINTDVVVAGNMGSVTRLNYTVIGDGVNLGSRIESLTKYYGVPVLVSEATREKAKGFAFREIDRARVKGKVRPVTLYEPIGAEGTVGEETRKEIEEFEKALLDYRARRFAESAARLDRLRNRRPGEKLYGLYRERISAFLAEAPPEDWDGSFSHTSK